MDDVFNLARAGEISYIRALDIVSYLENETEYYPWYSAFTAFTFLRRRIGQDDVLEPLLKVNTVRGKKVRKREQNAIHLKLFSYRNMQFN